ncbi:MAG: DUF2871 domain-containing protein [Acholeplasmataceae bacterium]|jgi:hypothetical protein
MKRYLNFALGYAIAAMAGGVFYREFTKLNDFTGVTMLGKVHAHLFLLGTAVYLIIALFDRECVLNEVKTFKIFTVVYNIGLILMIVMMIIRGIVEVLGTEISRGQNSAISGMAGLAHILLGIGIILLLFSFRKLSKPKHID